MRHHYASQAASSADALPALRKAMMRETRALQGGQLPLHPDASVLLRQVTRATHDTCVTSLLSRMNVCYMTVTRSFHGCYRTSPR